MNEVEQPSGSLACQNCGGALTFAPGTESLACPYCGTLNEIASGGEEGAPVEEQDYEDALADPAALDDVEEQIAVTCGNCGAEITLEPNVTASTCAFCATPLVAQQHSQKHIKPKSLLSFKVTRDEARDRFQQWVKGRWFAPGALKRIARSEGLTGVYSPFWTYDSDTASVYRGERGEHYTVTETYHVTVDGKQETRTRQVRKTRWHAASGRVTNTFDDVLVRASHSLPATLAANLEPWDLEALTPFQRDYLSGFTVESYTVGLKEGFAQARGVMEKEIRKSVQRDIGGDEQRVHSLNTNYANITFKHILLPVWISAYRFREKTYRFLINARTGEVQGERPYSAWKIVALLLGIAAAGLLIFVLSR